ncbi:putative secreted protein with PEP-CTERM sorting signal [Janthinobacterium sp. 67]|uniref:PEP-CTERM sorting domain-containing protein n=1 Tax=Janthinobacterium sp. 67 TaxID=2035207 RepID=UPI000CA98487|nr:PEP-CTERM sorting domain-containing protein [Janthinobacterium sp. 67]PJJ21910.1 putative secreted protein with PEP-CTERM sorting signal [Janthinobacterium sp. 67]
MSKPRIHHSAVSAAFAAALFMTAGMAQAQATAAQAENNSKRCEAANTDGDGKGGEFNPDSSSSGCSLANGFVNFGTRSNDGVGSTPDFSKAESDQMLRTPAFSGNSHGLASALSQPVDSGYGASPNLLASTGEHHFGSRDFVYAQEEPAIEGRGYRVGRALGASDVYEPLLTSSGGGIMPPAGGGGVGGGGASGGFDRSGGGNGAIDTGGGGVVPPIPAVPEPETYAMLLAGLGLLTWVGRRRSKAQA